MPTASMAQTTVTLAAGTAQPAIQGSQGRHYLALLNVGSTDAWASVGAAAAVGTGIYLPAGGGGFTWGDGNGPVPDGTINVISAGATTITVIEG